MWSKCNESFWSINGSIMNCIFFCEIDVMILNTYWVLLGISKPKFVWYCSYISLGCNIFVTVWYCQFAFWYCYVLFGQNIESKYCVGIDWQPKKVIPRISDCKLPNIVITRWYILLHAEQSHQIFIPVYLQEKKIPKNDVMIWEQLNI